MSGLVLERPRRAPFRELALGLDPYPDGGAWGRGHAEGCGESSAGRAEERVDVMLVEDDPDHREVLSEILELEGFSVSRAEEGGEALRHLRAGVRPSVILLDLMMRGMDGPEFRRIQRTEPAFSAIPVVVISGDGRGREWARELDAADFLMKPVDIGRVVEAVRRFSR